MSESEHKHIFRPIKEKPNFCWQCGVAEIDGTFYYPSFQFDKLKEQNEKLKAALQSISLSMSVHYDCSDGSEFMDMVNIANKTLKFCES